MLIDIIYINKSYLGPSVIFKSVKAGFENKMFQTTDLEYF